MPGRAQKTRRRCRWVENPNPARYNYLSLQHSAAFLQNFGSGFPKSAAARPRKTRAAMKIVGSIPDLIEAICERRDERQVTNAKRPLRRRPSDQRTGAS